MLLTSTDLERRRFRSGADEALCKNLNQLGMGVASLRNPAPHGDAVQDKNLLLLVIDALANAC